MHCISIDIGGYKILGGRIDEKGKILQKKKIILEDNKKDYLLTKLRELIKELIGNKIECIVVGFPGYVSKDGVVSGGPNIFGFDNFDLKGFIKDYFEAKKVYVINDAILFTAGEALIRDIFKNKKTLIGLTLGSGIGGGVVINGFLRAEGSEFGHQIIEKDGRICGCGKRGCLEAYVSVKSMKEITNEDIFKLHKKAKEGDKKAKDIFDNFSYYLAIGISNLIHLFFPDFVIIGGSGGELKLLVELTRQKVKDLVMYKELKGVKIQTSGYKGLTPLLGGLYFLKK